MEILAVVILSVFGFLSIIWGLTLEWGKNLTALLLYVGRDISFSPALTYLVDDSDYQNKLKEGKKTPSMRVIAFIGGLIFLGLGVTLLTIDMWYPDVPSSSTHKYLSESTQRKIFYDMIATQDQNPYSNEWDQSVKQAAADSYNVPMSQISDIIQKGATEGWLQPDPP